jgi:hypothetical protein
MRYADLLMIWFLFESVTRSLPPMKCGGSRGRPCDHCAFGRAIPRPVGLEDPAWFDRQIAALKN